MKKKVIVNKVKGTSTLSWDELKQYEYNNLKDGEGDIKKLKKSIIQKGFCFPFYIWANNKYVIDGNGRNIALTELEAAKWKISELPVVYIEASNIHEAKELVLMASSRYREVTQESFANFVVDLQLPEISNIISFPGINFELPMSLNKEEPEKQEEVKNKYEVCVECDSETHQKEIFEALTNDGYNCKILIL